MFTTTLIALFIACSTTSTNSPLSDGGVGDTLTVATFNGGSVSMAEVMESVGAQERAMTQKYKTERYNLLKGAADSQASEQLLQAAANAGGYPDINALLAVEVEAKASTPTDEEFEMLVAQVSSQNPTVPIEQIRAGVAQEMGRRAQMERYYTYVEELKTNSNFTLNLPYPEMPRIEISVRDDDPVRGPRDAAVTIIEFTEYQCPYCKHGAPTMDALVAKYDGAVRVITKDYPLSFHEHARSAAIAGHCAAEQASYNNFADLMFENQPNLARADLIAYATQLNLNTEQFTTCLDNDRPASRVDENVALATSIGVEATPTYFVNGIMLSGALPIEEFSVLIDAELSK
jgi:protein-disulfide isomerase